MIERKLTDEEAIVFIEGIMEGIRLYAVWKDGQEVVGCMQTPLKEVLVNYQNMIAKRNDSIASLKEARASMADPNSPYNRCDLNNR